jgi:hypothetical protein
MIGSGRETPRGTANQRACAYTREPTLCLSQLILEERHGLRVVPGSVESVKRHLGGADGIDGPCERRVQVAGEAAARAVGMG